METHYIWIVLAHTARGVLLDDILRDVDVLGAVQSGRQQGPAQVHLHLNIFYRIEINMQNVKCYYKDSCTYVHQGNFLYWQRWSNLISILEIKSEYFDQQLILHNLQNMNMVRFQ